MSLNSYTLSIMLCLQVNDACHIMPPHSTLIEVPNAPPQTRPTGMCLPKTPDTVITTKEIATTFIS